MTSDGCQPMLHSHVRVEINFAYVSRAEPFAAVVEEVMKPTNPSRATPRFAARFYRFSTVGF